MTVRKTESRIPAGFTADDLGQACIFDSGGQRYALISTLVEPIAVGPHRPSVELEYVVFVETETGASAVDYSWECLFYSVDNQLLDSKREPSPECPAIFTYAVNKSRHDV